MPHVRIYKGMSPKDDSRLLLEASRGNESAFTELYQRYHEPVFRFASHMSGSSSVAEDITQEVFLFLIQNPASYDHTRGSLAPFLIGVARNMVLRHLRKTRPVEEFSDCESTEVSPLTTVLHGERMEKMRQAILNLPPQFREVLVLCELTELSYEEAADAIGCAIGTVRSRLHRARNQLMRMLTESRDAQTEKPRGGTTYELPVF